MTVDLRIALINVVLDGDYQYEQEIPLGLASIASFLRSKGYPLEIHQCLASKGEDRIQAAVEVDANVYGMQLTMVNYEQVRNVAAGIKKLRPHALIVCGGPFLATLAETILRNEPLFDYLVVGEGEFTFLELLDKLGDTSPDFSLIQSLVWRSSSGEVCKNPLRKPIGDLDCLPFPARDFMELAQRDPVDGGMRESVRVITSRGCVGRCSFCCVNLSNEIARGKRWRGRSPTHVVDELEYLIKYYHARIFNFSDSSFEDPGEIGKKRARRICEEIIRRGLSLSAKVYMRCETMKTENDIDLLKTYKKAGVDVVIIGAEAGSDFELDLYEKRASLEDNYRTAKFLRDLDIFYVLVGFIMYGPYSTAETLRANIEFLNDCGLTDNVMHLNNVLMLVRGSKLFDRLLAEGRVEEPINFWEQPRYVITDPVGRRMALHWQNLYSRFPVTKEINALQMNSGNILARMTNPMNERILQTLGDAFSEFKERSRRLAAEFGNLNYEYFKEILHRIENDCSDEDLEERAMGFFGNLYRCYLPKYKNLHDGFISHVENAGFGMSGLVFRSFFSRAAIDGTQRVASKS